jgi:hypothetical protein
MKGKKINYYTGIGSRKTPEYILLLMTNIAIFLDKKGYILRSGGAVGADSAFEKGAIQKEIYLPWRGFNNSEENFIEISQECLEMAKKFHPNWEYLSSGAKKLHSRNCYQILGENLKTPSRFVICWTPKGEEVGGTSQALRIAKYFNIKIFNLHKEEDRNYWKKYV